MTGGIGLDYAFECCGILNCMTSALNACRKVTCVLTLVGLANMDAQVPFNPWLILTGRTVKGTFFGGWKSRDQVPQLVDQYIAKEIKVDEFISHTLPIESINDAVDLMKTGKWYMVQIL